MWRYDKIKIAHDKIKKIQIQGATNIAIFAFEVMREEILLQNFKSTKDLQNFFKRGSHLLMDARDTEPMLFNWMLYAADKLEKMVSKKIPLDQIQKKLAWAFSEFLEIVNREKTIRQEIWQKLIDEWDNVLNHCHSSSAINILKKAWDFWTKFHVYNTETRPLYQGRKTSKELVKYWIPTTQITDWSAPFFVDNLHYSHTHINKVIVWCDAIKLNWDVINKVWSFWIWLAAWHSGIPVYIAWSLTKIDTNDTIEIEVRDWKELRPEKPEKLEIVNYAFDVIPAKCITWIITEYGIIRPENLEKAVKEHCPWIIK